MYRAMGTIMDTARIYLDTGITTGRARMPLATATSIPKADTRQDMAFTMATVATPPITDTTMVTEVCGNSLLQDRGKQPRYRLFKADDHRA